MSDAPSTRIRIIGLVAISPDILRSITTWN